MNLNDALQHYLTHLNNIGTLSNSLYIYRQYAAQILNFFGNKPLERLTRSDITEFMRLPRGLGINMGDCHPAHNIDRARAFFKQFFFWCLEQGHTEDNPLSKKSKQRRSR